jgi:DNA-binding transcriptional ArsR family regulator
MEETGPEIRTELALAPPRGAALAILRALATGPFTVNELVKLTGLSQPNVSNHLARLRARHWVRSQRQGRNIFYSIAHPAVSQFLHALAGIREAVIPESPDDAAQLLQLESDYLAAILMSSFEEAAAVVEQAVASGIGWDIVYLRVFRPSLERMGTLWAEQGLPVSVEHAATAITLRLMHRLHPIRGAILSRVNGARPARRADAGSGGRRRAIVACVPGELHAVGARMVADFLIAMEWDVLFLDANVPAPALVEAAIRYLPHAVFLSATTPDRGDAITDSLTALHTWRADRPLPLLAGGGQFFSRDPAPWPLEVVGSDLPGTLWEVEAALETLGA